MPTEGRSSSCWCDRRLCARGWPPVHVWSIHLAPLILGSTCDIAPARLAAAPATRAHDHVPEPAKFGVQPHTRFYQALDENIPTWLEIIDSSKFRRWGLERASDTGSRMLDLLYALWRDLAWNAEQFAAILRLYLYDASGFPDAIPRRIANPTQSRYGSHGHLLSGRYEVLRKLGSGGNGDVFLAWSHETLSLYGLKVMRKELMRKELGEAWSASERREGFLSGYPRQHALYDNGVYRGRPRRWSIAEREIPKTPNR